MPHLFVVDADIIRCIMLKDFDHFRDRRHLDFGHDMFFETLDVLPCKRILLAGQFIGGCTVQD